MFRITRLAVLTGAVAIALPLGSATLVAAQEPLAATSEVSVFHAIPNIVVDVYANGEVLLTDFEQGALTDPVTLPEGEYDLKLVNAGDGPDGKALLSADNFPVPAGENLTVVAHLNADGEAIITPFVNNNADISAGEARLTVRHIAAAPNVDVRANGDVLFGDLANPDQAESDVAAGMVSADVVLAGTDTVAIGPEDLELEEGVNTIVYAWGNGDGGELALAVQKINGIDSAPNAVPGGTGGDVARSTSSADAGLTVLGGAASALLAFVLLRLTTRRAH
jgi:Domain of unknown function (DUF4397)